MCIALICLLQTVTTTLLNGLDCVFLVATIATYKKKSYVFILIALFFFRIQMHTQCVHTNRNPKHRYICTQTSFNRKSTFLATHTHSQNAIPEYTQTRHQVQTSIYVRKRRKTSMEFFFRRFFFFFTGSCSMCIFSFSFLRTYTNRSRIFSCVSQLGCIYFNRPFSLCFCSAAEERRFHCSLRLTK